jgi:pyrimidine-nucleoside phosphorylase
MKLTSITEFIASKRDGQEHSADEIAAFTAAIVSGEVPDYQISAWLMAAYLRGLSRTEVVALARAMAGSGYQYPLGHFGPHAVDKHSTGGVGDKTSLVVVPLCAAAGAVVPKMAGRGLGFTGGTIDKLESIPGFQVQLELPRFEEVVTNVGCAIVAQSPALAPADGILYALRDATATVESPGLIATSVMSKKLALGCPAIVIDLKVGRGSFCQDLEQARELGALLAAIAQANGRRLTIVYSSMEQPLGSAVGHALEVLEAAEVLRGAGPEDLREHCLAVASEMILAAQLVPDLPAAKALCRQVLQEGSGFAKFLSMIGAQGGDAEAVAQGRLPLAQHVRPVLTSDEGYVLSVDARQVARALQPLGATRQKKGDPIDLTVGVKLLAKQGEWVKAGEPLALVYANTERAALEAELILRSAYRLSSEACAAAGHSVLCVERF